MFSEDPFWVGFFFILGALWGSFANVAIVRIPQGLSVVRPRSRCNDCLAPIKWYDNIPIVSWFVLGGKCRACGKRFSIRYPAVEFLTGFLFAMLFLSIGWKFQLAEILLFTLGLVIVSFIDIDHYIIPDMISLPGIALGLLGAAINPERDFLDALYGVLLGGGILWAIAYVYFVLKKQEGMGGGDIKLLAWIGAVCGWKSVPFVILASSVLGSVVGLFLMSSSKKGLKTVIPFGPYLAVSALVYIVCGQALADWYVKLFFPWLE